MEKKNVSISINKALNGFILERSWNEVKEGEDFGGYKSEKTLLLTWDKVVDHIKNNSL